MKCPQCKSADIPCWHQHHAECVGCGYDVGSWSYFVISHQNEEPQVPPTVGVIE